MKIKLNITEDIIKLIPFFNLQENDNKICIDKSHMYLLGEHLMDDLGLILGKDKLADKASREDPDGKVFPQEIEEYMLGVHRYIVENLHLIESLIHQYVIMGGIKPGVYECNAKDMIWYRLKDKDE